tara:strand:- start:163 stop:531 length:369 start_codon:yes stop_codon:yes gene_type:complete
LRPLPYHGSTLPTELYGLLVLLKIRNFIFYQSLFTGISSRSLHIYNLQSKTVQNYGGEMGIHYDYKSTRGEKAMRKEAKRKARLEQRKAKRNLKSKTEEPEDKMHDIQKTITLDDLTNPDKS